MAEVTRPGMIVYDSNACTGCGVCEVVCSLYHEGEVRPALSRSHLVREPFTAKHRYFVCQQCHSPKCYSACSLKDQAMRIDHKTGIILIDESICTGCGMCIEACPFDPPRIRINPDKNTVFKCDLCMGRKNGPICIEYCPFQALKNKSRDGRV
jgi:Fe-S-cluster-containing dehydrogenase component